MTSGGENVHGVSGVRSGYRYAVGMWCTTEYNRAEHAEFLNEGWLEGGSESGSEPSTR